MRRSDRSGALFCAALLAAASLVSCTEGFTPNDDANAGGGGNTSMSSASGANGGSGAVGQTGGAGGMASSAGGAGAGGAGATGGGGAAGGAGGCPDILILDGMPAECATMGANALALADTTICPSDSGVFWPAKVYEIPVSVGDCLYMQADNVGSPSGADLFGATVEPGGKSVLWDEEIPCSVTNPDGYACPAGGSTMEASGTAYVMVGTFEGNGCMPGDATPFEVSVAVNGVDVDLSSSAVCAGDLLEIIP